MSEVIYTHWFVFGAKNKCSDFRDIQRNLDVDFGATKQFIFLSPSLPPSLSLSIPLFSLSLSLPLPSSLPSSLTRDVSNIRGFTREVLVALAANIESREWRYEYIKVHGLPPAHPRSATTDDVECLFSVLRDNVGKDFTLKQVYHVFSMYNYLRYAILDTIWVEKSVCRVFEAFRSFVAILLSFNI